MAWQDLQVQREMAGGWGKDLILAPNSVRPPQRLQRPQSSGSTPSFEGSDWERGEVDKCLGLETLAWLCRMHLDCCVAFAQMQLRKGWKRKIQWKMSRLKLLMQLLLPRCR